MSQLPGMPSPPDKDPGQAMQPPDAASHAPAQLPAQAAPLSGTTVPSTRTGTAWGALGLGMLLLILVLVFVLQNLTSASTSFFSVKWTIPLGLDLLLAALLGGVIVFLLGAARMFQLRRVARRRARTQRRG